MPYRADSAPRPRRGLVSVDIDGDAVVYDEELETTHLLNSTAAVVWNALDGRTTLADLAGDLAEAFGIDEEEAAAAVVALVGDLDSQGLLDQGPGDSPPAA